MRYLIKASYRCCKLYSLRCNTNIALSEIPKSYYTKSGPSSVTGSVEFVKRFYSPTPSNESKRTRSSEINEQDCGKRVSLYGWVHSIRDAGAIKFIVLRDYSGRIQLVVENDNYAKYVEDTKLSVESVLKVCGIVQTKPQPKSNQVKINLNNKLQSPMNHVVEVNLESIEILNAASLPYALNKPPKEDIRLKFRYIDLRQPFLARNMKVRSQVAQAARNILYKDGFTEVETPTLFKATPEGSAEFLVPTRHKGKFYCLPQSPQQYKQLLMVGGVEKYFQFARCYRDEDLRADRQPEFTQIDLEMAFCNEKDVKALTEKLIRNMWAVVHPSMDIEFNSMTYHDAMLEYGVDKPDTTFAIPIRPLKYLLKDQLTMSNSAALCNHYILPPEDLNLGLMKHIEKHYILQNRGIYGVYLEPKLAKHLTSEDKKRLQMLLRKSDLTPTNFMEQSLRSIKKMKDEKELGFTWLLVSNGDGQWEGTEGSGLNEEQLVALTKEFISPNCDNDALLFIASSNQTEIACKKLGQIRLAIAHLLDSKGIVFRNKDYSFLWVDQFPLFEADHTDDGRSIDPVNNRNLDMKLSSTHHPFTCVHPSDEGLLFSHPHVVRGLHYDIVVNGIELGGGSVRIHKRDVQEKVFKEVLKVNPEYFTHLLQGLSSGCPPHAGIALGYDRLLSVLLKTNSIRDVIAFPKSFRGLELMSDAPTAIDVDHLQTYGIQLCDMSTSKDS